MGLVSLEELEVNFAHGCQFPDALEDGAAGGVLYPFGILDEQLVHYEQPILVESHLHPHYLAISSNSHLARHLRQIAGVYNCVDIEKYDKIFLPNPNNKFTQHPMTLTKSLIIYFVGILCCSSDNLTRYLILKVV